MIRVRWIAISFVMRQRCFPHIGMFSFLHSFVNFCYLSQSEVSTDNRKVSTFFAFQHVRCRCCYRSYLDRFLMHMHVKTSFALGGQKCSIGDILTRLA